MAQASVAPGRSPRPAPTPRVWVGPLVIGFSFALGFGLTERLVELNLSPSIDLGHGFDVQPFPGTSLESLRMRFGAQEESLRANPDELPEAQPKKETPAEPAPAPRAREAQGVLEPEPSSVPEEKPSAEPGASALETPVAPVLPEPTPAR